MAASTFVVSFIGDDPESFRGRVKHVATGEEARFTSVTDLLMFFEEMNALRSQSDTVCETPADEP